MSGLIVRDLIGLFDSSGVLQAFLDANGNEQPLQSAVLQSLVGGTSSVAGSRSALASDNGTTLELASGVTYTLTNAVSMPAGVVLLGPASGSATIACTGSATINGATSSITVSAGQVYSAIPRATSTSAYVVKGS